MGWMLNIGTRGERGEMYGIVFLGNAKRRDHLKDLSVDGRMVLKWILKIYGCFEFDTLLPDSLKSSEFTDQLNDC